jgi:chemotaxis protein methyltransferase CheR
MKSDCVAFLQWALPRLGLAWPGFRRVHRQVCKRIGRRLQSLRLGSPAAYRAHLDSHPEEWRVLDSMCRIPVSRLVRDRIVFERLAGVTLPCLAARAMNRTDRTLSCWSAGCASGEEPYSLSVMWKLELAPRFPDLGFRVLATDVDERLLERARRGQYQHSSLREVPPAWIEAAFTRRARLFVLRPEFHLGVEFLAQDLRQHVPSGPFDLVLCRNLAFTYFDAPLQRLTLMRVLAALRPGGGLVIGRRERLPEGAAGLDPWIAELGVYRRAEGPQLGLGAC